eukprot:gene5987-9986_t
MVQPDVTVGIFGPENSGKSTLFSAIVEDNKKILGKKIHSTVKFELDYFETFIFKFNLIDTPGKTKYIKNMIRFMSVCDFGILNLSTNSEEYLLEEFLALAKGFDLKKLIICINKMDKIQFSKEKFENISKTIQNSFTEFNFQGISIIPISCETEDNIHEKTDNMKWYIGNTLIEELNSSKKPERDYTSPLRILMFDKIQMKNPLKYILYGKIEQGIAEKFVSLQNSCKQNNDIFSFKKQNIDIKYALAGEIVTITMNSARDFQLGDVIGIDDYEPPRASRKFIAKVSIQKGKIRKGSCPIIDSHSDHVVCKIKEIESIISFDDEKIIQNSPVDLKKGESGIVEFEPQSLFCLEIGSKFGKFIIRDGSSIIGYGIVIQSYMKKSVKPMKKDFPETLSQEEVTDIIKDNVYCYQYLPQKWRKNEYICKISLLKTLTSFLHFDEELQNKEKFFLGYVKSEFPIMFAKDLKRTEEFAKKMMMIDGSNLKYFDEEITSNFSFILEHVSLKSIPFVSHKLRSNEEFMTRILKKDILISLAFAGRNLKKNEKYVKLALHKNGLDLKYVSSNLLNNRDIVKIALKQNGESIKYCPEKFKYDKELILIALNSYPDTIVIVPESMKKDKDIAIKAMKKDGSKFCYVSNYFKDDPDVVLASLKESYSPLSLANKNLLSSKEFMLKVIKIQPKGIQLAPNFIQNDRDIVFECVKNDGYVLTLLKPFWNDKLILLECLKNIRSEVDLNHLFLLLSPNREHLKDLEFLKKAVAYNHLVFPRLKKISHDICKEYDVILKLMMENFRIFEYLCTECKNDYQIVRIAVLGNPILLEHASSNMKQNQELSWLFQKRFKVIREVNVFNIQFRWRK